AFDTIFSTSYAQTDAVVSGRSVVDYSAGGGGATLPASLVGRIRALPHVAAASGSILDLSGDTDQAKLVDPRGEVISGNGAPTFGFGIDASQPRFSPFSLVRGRWAAGVGEVVVDAASARKHD